MPLTCAAHGLQSRLRIRPLAVGPVAVVAVRRVVEEVRPWLLFFCGDCCSRGSISSSDQARPSRAPSRAEGETERWPLIVHPQPRGGSRRRL